MTNRRLDQILCSTGSLGSTDVARVGKGELNGKPVVYKVAVEATTPAFVDHVSQLLSLEHRALPKYEDYAFFHGRPCLVMEYVEGEELETVIVKSGKIEEERAYRIVRELAGGLKALHSAGIVHRAICTSNIRLRGLEPCLVDLGFVTPSGQTAEVEARYVAPELRRGELPASRQTDLYSLGVILAELLAGQDYDPCNLSNIDVSPTGQSILTRLLAPDPAERFESADFLEAELDKTLREPMTSSGSFIGFETPTEHLKLKEDFSDRIERFVYEMFDTRFVRDSTRSVATEWLSRAKTILSELVGKEDVSVADISSEIDELETRLKISDESHEGFVKFQAEQFADHLSSYLIGTLGETLSVTGVEVLTLDRDLLPKQLSAEQFEELRDCTDQFGLSVDDARRVLELVAASIDEGKPWVVPNVVIERTKNGYLARRS